MKKLIFVFTFFFFIAFFGHKVSANTDLYRLYHPSLKVHLYTKDLNEYNTLGRRGWQQENVAWSSSSYQGETVYRLYHPSLKVHLYTKDLNEYNTLGLRGWRKEGSAFKSYGNIKIYRLYHSSLQRHLYTKDVNEYNTLGLRGWRKEGVAFYGERTQNKTNTQAFEIDVKSDKIHVLNRFSEASDFILLQSNGRYGLVDAGYQSGSTLRYAIDYLKNMGIRELDFVILTHFDEDHVTFLNTQNTNVTSGYNLYSSKRPLDFARLGSKELLNNFKIRKVIMRNADSRINYEVRAREQVVATLNAYGIPYTYERRIRFGDFNITLYNDYPLNQEELSQPQLQSNYNSTVTLIEKGSYNVLLLADTEKYDEGQLATDLIQNGNQAIDFVQAGHHGLSTSNEKDFVNRIGNPLAVATYSYEYLDQKGKENMQNFSGQLYAGRGTVVADLTDTTIGLVVTQPDTNFRQVIKNNRNEGISR